MPPAVRSPDDLVPLIRERVGDRLFVSVSNREPFAHTFGEDGAIEVRATVGGVSVALNAVMRAVGGTWVAHGSGSADREAADAEGRVRVPPDDPRYELRRVWLDEAENDLYYNGCANEALWPLCHNAYTKPVFRDAHWRAYRAVNRKFADAVAKAVGQREAVVFIQDYHFALLPAMIRERCPRATLLHFWHIPWPLPDILRICPWREELLEGILGNDVVGVHTPQHAERFTSSAAELPGWKRAAEGVLARGERRVRVQPFPISVDFEAIAAEAAGSECAAAVARLRERFNLDGKFVVVGLERIDYTKGVLERLEAIRLLLDRHPEMRGRLAYLHAGAPSRSAIPAYRDLNRSMQELQDRINAEYGSARGDPVLPIQQHLAFAEVLALYRLADVCVVSSLDDGMNLVAKEFVSARNDGGGRLLLSEFTGAAWELADAETFNPFAVDAFAERLFAMRGPSGERDRARMRALREHVRAHNVYGWIGSILEALPAAA